MRRLARPGFSYATAPPTGSWRDIIRFASADGLVYAHTAAGASATDYTLAELEARTAGDFIRSSRAELTAVAHITSIAGAGDGSATLTMTAGPPRRCPPCT